MVVTSKLQVKSNIIKYCFSPGVWKSHPKECKYNQMEKLRDEELEKLEADLHEKLEHPDGDSEEEQAESRKRSIETLTKCKNVKKMLILKRG